MTFENEGILRMLGSLELEIDGAPVDPGGPKQRALLSYLVLHEGEPVSLAALVEAVWGDGAPDGSIRSLRTYASNLRRLLGGAARISGEQGAYRLDMVSLETDVETFRRRVREASEVAEPKQRSLSLESALDLWRGPFLAGVDRPWVQEASSTFDREHRQAVVEWAEATIAAGHPSRVITTIERAISDHPYDEQLCGLLMRALYQVGRQSDALAVYRRLRVRLGDDLGLEPGPELRRLEKQILLHEAAGEPGEPGWLLPAPATDLVGRGAEIEDLLARIEHVRLLTLTGPGGVGKTRLALEVGRRTLEGKRPVFLADLSPVSEASAVSAILAESAGVLPHPNAGRLESLVEYLRPRSALLIVDNCEHLASTVARSLAALLHGCPRLTIVATSRSPLHIDGEVEWRTPPLALPEPMNASSEGLADVSAVELLIRRAPSGFRVTDDNAADIVVLCHSLDGLPLALELAASRLGALTPAEIVTALERSMSLARPGARDTPRHAAIDVAIDWSFQLLSDSARQLLVRLGVMAGWFLREDALAVCSSGVPEELLGEELSNLVDQSLVTADTSGPRTRYRLLETIKRFARDRLRDEELRLRRLHADHFAHVAETEAARLLGPAEGEAIIELAAAHDNFRAVIDWSMDTGETEPASRIVAVLPDGAYWRSRNELSVWASWVWEHITPADQRWRAVCGCAARGAWVEGRFDDAVRIASLASDTGTVIARSGYPDDVIADVALYRGDAVATHEHHTRVAAAASAGEDRSRLIWATYYLAVTHAVLGRTAEAVEAAARAFAAARDMGNPTALAFSLYAGGLAVKHQSPAAAVTMFEESVRMAESVSNEWFGGVARMELASTMTAHGDLREGLRRFIGVIDHWQRVGDDTQLRHSWRYLVRALYEAGCHDGAAILTGALLADTQSILTHPHPRVLQGLAEQLGEAHYAQLTVRGSVMSVSELVLSSIDAIERVLAQG